MGVLATANWLTALPPAEGAECGQQMPRGDVAAVVQIGMSNKTTGKFTPVRALNRNSGGGRLLVGTFHCSRLTDVTATGEEKVPQSLWAIHGWMPRQCCGTGACWQLPSYVIGAVCNGRDQLEGSFMCLKSKVTTCSCGWGVAGWSARRSLFDCQSPACCVNLYVAWCLALVLPACVGRQLVFDAVVPWFFLVAVVFDQWVSFDVAVPWFFLVAEILELWSLCWLGGAGFGAA